MRVVFIENVILEQRLEAGQGVTHTDIWRSSIAGQCLASLFNIKKASVAVAREESNRVR